MPTQPHTLLVLDVDNTLVPETEGLLLSPFYTSLHDLVSQYVPNLDFNEFMDTSDKTFTETGCCVRGWAEKLGHDRAWVLQAYGHVAPAIYKATTASPLVKPDPLLKAKLLRLEKAGYKLVALTQGHHHYCLPLLKFVELDDVFPNHVVHDIVAVNGELKRSEAPYRYILNTYPGFRQYLMVEDTPANLVPAHKLGFETWFLGSKPVEGSIMPFINHRHATIHQTLDALLAA